MESMDGQKWWDHPIKWNVDSLKFYYHIETNKLCRRSSEKNMIIIVCNNQCLLELFEGNKVAWKFMNAAMVLNKRNRMELDNVKFKYSNIQRTILHLAKGIHLRKKKKTKNAIDWNFKHIQIFREPSYMWKKEYTPERKVLYIKRKVADNTSSQ